MSKNELVERQKTKDKRRKPKIVKWEYVNEPFDIWLHPQLVKRVHSPLPPSLTVTIAVKDALLHLRPCVQGVDEDGAVVKCLYCTRDGRFFVRGKDGWSERKINHTPNRPSLKDGRCHSAYPVMQNIGGKLCHLCIAHAWLGARPEGKVCDHLDTNLLNLNADNLQWVTPDENRRRKRITDRLKNKVGLNPKLLTPTLLRGIFGLPEAYFEAFVGRYLMACEECEDPMEIWSIRTCIAIALDGIRKLTNQSKLNEIK